MRCVVVPDIFGVTPELGELVAGIGGTATIINPYAAVADRFWSTPADFHSESQAYTFFTTKVGLDAYTRSVSRLLVTMSEVVLLVGFSMGASAVWRATCSPKCISTVRLAVGFYGSQIRHFCDESPAVPFRFIMPATERHFSVQRLTNSLSVMPNVSVQMTPYLHGFMNRRSEHFDPDAYGEFLNVLNELAAT